MRNVLHSCLVVVMSLSLWRGGVLLAQSGEGGTPPAKGANSKPPTSDTEKILRGLRDKGSHVRSETMHILWTARHLPNSVVEVIAELAVRDPSSVLRYTAIQILGDQDAPPRLAPVLRGLDDEDPHVRAHAAIVLGHWGKDAAPAAVKLLSALAEERNEYSVNLTSWGDYHSVRYHVATALGEIGPAANEAVAALRQIMKNGGKKLDPPDDRKIVDREPYEPPGKEEEKEIFRVAAALAVIRICKSDAEALDVLTNRLSSPWEGVRSEAGQSVGAAGPMAKAALEVMLTKVHEEKSNFVRSKYMEAFGAFGVRDERVVKTLIAGLDEKSFARDGAIRSLAKLGSFAKEALPKLEAIIVNNADPADYGLGTQTTAIEAVLRIAEPEVAMGILRSKLEQVGEGLTLAHKIIPHLKAHGPQGEQNRQTLKWFIEDCREAERQITETADPAPSSAAPSPSPGKKAAEGARL